MGDRLSTEIVTDKIADLMEAKKVQFFADKGVVISKRTVTDNTTQLGAARLAAEILKMKTDKLELSTPGKDELQVTIVELPDNGR